MKIAWTFPVKAKNVIVLQQTQNEPISLKSSPNDLKLEMKTLNNINTKPQWSIRTNNRKIKRPKFVFFVEQSVQVSNPKP